MNSRHITKLLGFVVTVSVGYGGYAQLEKHRSRLGPDESLSSASNHQQEAKPNRYIPKSLATILNESNPAKRYLSLRRLQEDINPSEISSLLDSIRHLPEDRALRLLKIDLLTLWAESNPAGALAWAASNGRIGFDSSLEAIIVGWAKRDFAAALQWAKNLPRRDRSRCLHSIIGAMAETNITGALQLLETDSVLRSMPASSTIDAIFSNATRRDPRRAIEEALFLPPGERRTEALKSITETWVTTDPKAALSWIMELSPGELRDRGIRKAIQQLAFDDPESAAQLALKEIPSGQVREDAVSEALEVWADRDLSAARAWVEKLSSIRDRETFISTILAHELMHDPRAVLNYAMTAEWIEDWTLIYRTISKSLSISPQASIEWVKANASSLDPSYISDIFNGLAHRPVDAIHLVPLISEESSRAATYTHVAHSWAEVDIQAAEKWLDQMPDGPDKDAFFDGVIQGIADYDLSKAALIVTGLPDGQLKTNSVSRIAAGWAITDAPSALSWVSETVSGSNQETVVAEVITRWAHIDIASASDWLNTLAPGSLRDKAIASFSSKITDKNPQSAAIWATSISDEGARKATLRSVVERWMTSDDKAARAWMQSAFIPAGWKQQCLKR